MRPSRVVALSRRQRGFRGVPRRRRDAVDAEVPRTSTLERVSPWAEGVKHRPRAVGLRLERERDEQQGAEAAGHGRDEGLGHGELNNLRVDGR